MIDNFSDGDIRLDGINTVPWAILEGRTYTMTRHVRCKTLVVVDGVKFDASGYSIFASGDITIPGNSWISRIRHASGGTS